MNDRDDKTVELMSGQQQLTNSMARMSDNLPRIDSSTLANQMFKSLAPQSSHKVHKKTSVCFMFWVIAVNCSMFSSLLWYFFYGSCVPRVALTDNAYDITLSSSHSQINKAQNEVYNSFNTEGNHICGAMIQSWRQPNNPSAGPIQQLEYGTPCLLGSFTCHDYTSFSSKCNFFGLPHCDDYVEACGLVSKKNSSLVDASYYVYYENLEFAASVSVAYLSCTPTETAVVNSVQYTIYAQIIVITLYLVYAIVTKRGCSALIQARTWRQVFFNADDAHEDDGETENLV